MNEISLKNFSKIQIWLKDNDFTLDFDDNREYQYNKKGRDFNIRIFANKHIFKYIPHLHLKYIITYNNNMAIVNYVPYCSFRDIKIMYQEHFPTEYRDYLLKNLIDEKM